MGGVTTDETICGGCGEKLEACEGPEKCTWGFRREVLQRLPSGITRAELDEGLAALDSAGRHYVAESIRAHERQEHDDEPTRLRNTDGSVVIMEPPFKCKHCGANLGKGYVTKWSWECPTCSGAKNFVAMKTDLENRVKVWERKCAERDIRIAQADRDCAELKQNLERWQTALATEVGIAVDAKAEADRAHAVARTRAEELAEDKKIRERFIEALDMKGGELWENAPDVARVIREHRDAFEKRTKDLEKTCGARYELLNSIRKDLRLSPLVGHDGLPLHVMELRQRADKLEKEAESASSGMLSEHKKAYEAEDRRQERHAAMLKMLDELEAEEEPAPHLTALRALVETDG